MEILLHQRFSYARISLLRNYSHRFPMTVTIKQENDIFDLTAKNTNMIPISGSHLKPNAHYFYTKSKSGEEHATFDEVISMYYTEKERQIKRHYNNPFARLHITIHERTIKKKGDKIIITVVQYFKAREYNAKYFRTMTEKITFSFDLVKGNFLVLIQNGKNKNIVKSFRVNNFRQFFNILTNTHSPSIFMSKKIKKDDKIDTRFKEMFDDNVYYKVLSENFGLRFNEISVKGTGYINFYKKIMEKFVELRKIKLPNFDCAHLLETDYPKEPFLKKNDRKLIAAILDANKIKSKITIKLIHQFPIIPIKALVKFCAFFGKDYAKHLSAVNIDLFESLGKTIDKPNYQHVDANEYVDVLSSFDINDDEKSNIVKYVNDAALHMGKDFFLGNYFFRDLYDHFIMLDKIRKYDPNIRMRSKNRTEFTEEHSQLSKIITKIRKGWTIEYQFNPQMLGEVEKPINSHCECKEYPEGTKYITLYPYVLKREEEYYEEGNFMHHCVASYADKDKSIIVSIRTEDNQNRLTCEFDIASGRRIQARHFCNGDVPEEFKDALEEVSDKIAMHARWGILNWKEKKKVPVKINGIEIEPDTESNRALNWF